MDGGFVVFKSKMVGFKYTHTKKTHTHTHKKNGAYFKADTN